MKQLFFSFILLLNISVVLSQNIDEQLKMANQIYYVNPDSSFQLYKELENELSKTENNQIELAQTRLGQVKYLVLKTRFDEASKILSEIIPILKKYEKIDDLANCYSLKSIMAHKIKEKENTFKYAHAAYSLYVKSGNLDGELRVLTNLAMDYMNYQMYDSAYIALNKLFAYETKMSNPKKYYMFQNFGMYYYEIKDYKNAVYNFEKALQIAETENMTDSKATVLMLISKTYLAKKGYTKAFSFIEKSILISKEHKLIYELNEAYDQLILLYSQTGDYKKAYETKIINDSIKNEIYDIEKINRINQFESQLKLTEKEKVIAEQELTIKQKQLEQSEAKSKITSLLFVLIVCVLLIFFITFIFIRARKLNQEINAQKAQVELQKNIVEEKNLEITSSIEYAKKIQTAILPTQSFIDKLLPENFIFYLPKDIVAGDFYWIQPFQESILFAVADCTGHGVPGAMVSVVCHNALNRAVGEFQLSEPAKILDAVSEMVTETFSKNESEVQDGMDIALCSLTYVANSNLSTAKNQESTESLQLVAILEYVGANNSLYIIRNKELIETKPDKQPIGKFINKKHFTNHTIELLNDDYIYLFSDGYADQFGGEKGKKFMYKSFKDMLIKFHQRPLSEQKTAIKNIFYDWKGENDQVDDICVLGLKI